MFTNTALKFVQMEKISNKSFITLEPVDAEQRPLLMRNYVLNIMCTVLSNKTVDEK